MKTVLKQAALAVCIVFTLMSALSLPTGFYFAGPDPGLIIMASMLGACVALAALQAFWFSGLVLRRLPYPVRLAGFALTAAGSLFAIGWFANWFPHEIDVVVSFVLIFVVIFILATIGYSIYFKKTAGSYEAALEKYREQRSKDR